MRHLMNVIGNALVAIILIAVGGSDFAAAQNVHFKQNRAPTFIDGGLTLSAQGALVGLGNGDVVITLTAQADVVSTCTNPSGASQPPGQNPAPITVAGSQAIPANEVKNGTLSFNVSTQAPASTIAGAPDCPNSRWTESINDLKFTSATLTVQQPAPNVVLTATCTFSIPTSNGPGATSERDLPIDPEHGPDRPKPAAQPRRASDFRVSSAVRFSAALRCRC